MALALILFDGGLRTSLDSVRRVWRPALALSTIGVLLTSLITGLAAAWVLGLPLPETISRREAGRSLGMLLAEAQPLAESPAEVVRRIGALRLESSPDGEHGVVSLAAADPDARRRAIPGS